MSSASWTTCNSSWQAGHAQRRKRARELCVDEKHLETGAYCLPQLTHTRSGPHASKGQVRTILLPQNQSYVMPVDATFRSANHVEADGRIVYALAELGNQVPTHELLVNDFGAGVGQYGHALLAVEPELLSRYKAYDGAGNIDDWTKGFMRCFDLTDDQLGLPRAHWVLSVEVREHVPHVMLEGVLLRNLHAHNCECNARRSLALTCSAHLLALRCHPQLTTVWAQLAYMTGRGIILSWAAVGQKGQGHINVHTSS